MRQQNPGCFLSTESQWTPPKRLGLRSFARKEPRVFNLPEVAYYRG